MAGTPFIDILTPAQQQTVAQKSRGGQRPSYYDGTLAEVNARLKGTGDQAESTGAEVQISEDLEAVFILMSTADKDGLLAFLNSAIKIASSASSDDFALMSEVVAVRKTGYAQVYTDVGRAVSDYDNVRKNLLSFIDRIAHQKGSRQQDPVSVVVPDLGALFASLSDAYRSLAAPDILAVHDRIADTGTLYAYQNAATNRTKELSSWVAVVTLYQI